MKSPSPPPAPDYSAQATAQGKANVETAQTQGRINNPNVVTPFGRRDVTWNGDTATLTESLSPEMQVVHDNIMAASGAGSKSVKDVLSTPFNYDGISQRLGGQDLIGAGDKVRDALYSQSQRFLDPQFAQSDKETRTRLANQGFEEGNAGYQEALDNDARRKMMAYGDARDRSIVAGGQEQNRLYGMSDSERRSQIAERLTQRQQPLNEVNALQSSSQIGLPQYQGFTGGGNIAPPPLFAASQSQYGAGLDNYNARAGAASQNNAAMGSLAGTAITAAVFF